MKDFLVVPDWTFNSELVEKDRKGNVLMFKDKSDRAYNVKQFLEIEKDHYREWQKIVKKHTSNGTLPLETAVKSYTMELEQELAEAQAQQSAKETTSAGVGSEQQEDKKPRDDSRDSWKSASTL